MLKLPDVTLVLIETREHELGRLALEDCERHAEFGDTLIFTDKPEVFGPRRGANGERSERLSTTAPRRIVEVPDWLEKKGWSQCSWYDVSPHLRTSHALYIQWDSWITEPEMWRDEYLKYDLIGAPWWYKDGMNVGNLGFSVRSTKILRFIRKNRDRYPCITDVDDDLYCRKYRPALQAEGFEWAPEPLAYDFAVECVRPDPKSRHFGFHAAFNFDYGCGYSDERLLERAQLMAQSSYLAKKGSYIWRSFEQKFPQIAAQAVAEGAKDG